MGSTLLLRILAVLLVSVITVVVCQSSKTCGVIPCDSPGQCCNKYAILKTDSKCCCPRDGMTLSPTCELGGISLKWWGILLIVIVALLGLVIAVVGCYLKIRGWIGFVDSVV